MADAPNLQGLRPVPEKEDKEEVAPVVSAPAPSPYIRPEHRPMNCYPSVTTKNQFEDAVHELAEEFRRKHGRKIPNGVIHDAALSFVLANWDIIADPFRK